LGIIEPLARSKNFEEEEQHMKKLLVLSVLLGLMVLPVFAEHASTDFGGDDTLGFISDFGDVADVTTDLTWDVIVGIDDYNSFTWSLKGLNTGGDAIALDKALTTTDIGMWLGLPVGIKAMWGYDDPDANEFGDVTGYGNQAYDFSPNEYWGFGLMVSASFFELEVALSPGGLGDLLIGAAVKEPIAGLNAEVYWFQNAANAADYSIGSLGVGVAYAAEIGPAALDVGVSFEYDLGGSTWDYGAGVAAEVAIADVSVGLMGMDGSAVDSLSASLDLALMDKLDIYAGMETSLSGAGFTGADVGLAGHIGAVTAYVGYLITSAGGGDYNAPSAPTDGGLYLKFDVDY
jgi:hypothetical protein